MRSNKATLAWTLAGLLALAPLAYFVALIAQSLSAVSGS